LKNAFLVIKKLTGFLYYVFKKNSEGILKSAFLVIKKLTGFVYYVFKKTLKEF
jgi:hypothetical protein